MCHHILQNQGYGEEIRSEKVAGKPFGSEKVAEKTLWAREIGLKEALAQRSWVEGAFGSEKLG